MGREEDEEDYRRDAFEERERKWFVDMPDRPGDVEFVREKLRAAITRAEGM